MNASPERRVMKLLSGCEVCRTQLIRGIQVCADDAEKRLASTGKELTGAAARREEKAETALIRLKEKLEAISPLRVLERGYSLVTDRTGRILSGTKQAREAGDLSIRFKDGSVDATVKGNGD